MRRSLLLWCALAAVATAPLTASAAPRVGLVSRGLVHFQTYSERYSLPTLGPFRFRGTIAAGSAGYRGTIDGSAAVLDVTAAPTFTPIVLSTADGDLSGTCSAPGLPSPLGLDPGYRLRLTCSISIRGGAAHQVLIRGQALATSQSGDGTTDGMYTDWDGYFYSL